VRVHGQRNICIAAGAGDLAAVQWHLLAYPDRVFERDPMWVLHVAAARQLLPRFILGVPQTTFVPLACGC